MAGDESSDALAALMALTHFHSLSRSIADSIKV
jgi:hypothetical protein